MIDKYQLAETTVANFYREIAEHYLNEGDKATGLKWLKAGVEMNPKLGVKKQIIAIEKDLA